MSTKWLLTVPLCAAPLLAGVVLRGEEPAPPHATVTSAVASLRQHDLAGFFRHTLTTEEWQELSDAWDQERTRELDPEEEFGFNVALQMFLVEGAEQTLFAQLEPELAAYREQASFLSTLVVGMAQEGLANETSLNPDQKEDASVVLDSLGGFLTEDLADPQKAKRVIELVCEGLRATGVKDFRSLRALSFEELLERARPLFAALTGSLALYGVEIDAWLASIEAETVLLDGDRATVEVRYSILDEPQQVELQLVREEGRWRITND